MFHNSMPMLSKKQMEDNPILALLQKSTATFIFCGSRKFGGFTSESDWDFWAQNSEELKSWLVRQGFEDLSDEHYDDPGETIAVLRHQKFKVDVSLQKDINLTKAVMYNIIVFIKSYHTFTKDQRREILIALKAAYRSNWPKDKETIEPPF